MMVGLAKKQALKLTARQAEEVTDWDFTDPKVEAGWYVVGEDSHGYLRGDGPYSRAVAQHLAGC